MDKKGLVLEGGGMRGIYTAGVLDAFHDEDLSFDGIIGVSAGALHGSDYASNQPGRNLTINTKYLHDKRYLSFRSLLKTGDIFGADFCYNKIPNELEPFDYDTFKNKQSKFYVVCTDVETGKAEYIECSDMREDMDYMRASASLPLFSKKVSIKDKIYLDGGMADSIPVIQFEKMGYNKQIVVLTQPLEYRKKRNKLIPVFKVKYRKYKKFIEATANRHIMYNNTLDIIRQKELAGEIIVIRPEKSLGIGRLEKDIEKLQGAYETGRQDAIKLMPKIKEYLQFNVNSEI